MSFQILIIGGGDGGCVREILKHQSVQQIVLCDIDEVCTMIRFVSHLFYNCLK